MVQEQKDFYPVISAISHSPEETEALGEVLAACLRAGDVLTLDGDLGAGKTAFTRGLARGLGLDSFISSPTFTLVMEHPPTQPDKPTLFHFDAYRLRDEEDFLDSGLDEYFHRNGICVLEWGERVRPILPASSISVRLWGKENSRHIELLWPLGRADDYAHLQSHFATSPEKE